MNCKDFHLYESAYIDNMLSNEEKIAFEHHMAACESCKTSFNNLKAMIESVNEIEEIELPENFSMEFREKLVQEKNSTVKKTVFRKSKLFTNIAASILICVASFSLVNNNLVNYKMAENETREQIYMEENSRLKNASEYSTEHIEKNNEAIPQNKAFSIDIQTEDEMNDEAADRKKESQSNEEAEMAPVESNLYNNHEANRKNTMNWVSVGAIVIGIGMLVYNFFKNNKK